MFKIGNITRENNPRARRRGKGGKRAGAGIDTWTMIAAYSRAPSSGVRVRMFLAVSAAVLADCVTAIPRRMADRLFVANDAEAYWRGWQIVKIHGGLGRRYRDPMFDTLAACAQCEGQGQGIEEMPCIGCFGTGRLSDERLEGGVS